MPLRRYFICVGGVLLALFFLADWYAPRTAVPVADAVSVDRSIIRIQSAHRWPEAVVMDTTQPTIAPPAQLAWTDAPAAKPAAKTLPREAMAQAVEIPSAVAAHAVPSKPAKRRVRAARPAAPAERFANSEPFGFRPFFAPRW